MSCCCRVPLYGSWAILGLLMKEARQVPSLYLTVVHSHFPCSESQPQKENVVEKKTWCLLLKFGRGESSCVVRLSGGLRQLISSNSFWLSWRVLRESLWTASFWEHTVCSSVILPLTLSCSKLKTLGPKDYFRDQPRFLPIKKSQDGWWKYHPYHWYYK